MLKAHRPIETWLQVVLMTKLTVLPDLARSMTLRARFLRDWQEARREFRCVMLPVGRSELRLQILLVASGAQSARPQQVNMRPVVVLDVRAIIH